MTSTDELPAPMRCVPLRRPLTVMQARVVALVADGLPPGEIATALSLSPRTVRAHLEAVADQLPGRGSAYHRVALWVMACRAA